MGWELFQTAVAWAALSSLCWPAPVSIQSSVAENSTIATRVDSKPSVSLTSEHDVEEGPFFASGVKAVEATQDSVRLWVRLTLAPEADLTRLAILSAGLKTDERSDAKMPIDVVPGEAGEFRVRYWIAHEPNRIGRERLTEWEAVDAAHDFVGVVRLESLRPGTQYAYQVTARKLGREQSGGHYDGRFRTAPAPSSSRPVKFIVSTCQAVRSIDSGPAGHVSYRAMLKFEPDFFVHTGDFIYYDKAPFAKSMAEARAKWNVMFSYQYNRKFLGQVSSYFMKDDHDTLKNDCWPGQVYGELTFAQGLSIFREQAGLPEKTYRTVRWGQHVQFWMTENRDFRSSNRMPDGPDKTILGSEQKTWLKKTLSESDATYKFVISPGPLVGPDKRGKNDNHANIGFATEGDELREFLGGLENTFVICGDRHWQYCSEDPKTGLVEMGCGPINDQHMFGGNPGEDPRFHRYFSAKGGFLGVTVDGDGATAEWYGSGDERRIPFKVLHTETFERLRDGRQP